MSIKRGSVALLLAISGVFVGTEGYAQSIGMNWDSGRVAGGILAANDSAGVIPQINWNNNLPSNVDGPSSGDTSNIVSPLAGKLVDNTGTDSGATVTWTTPNTWGASSGSSSGDRKLQQNLLFTQAGDAVVTFGNIPYSEYDVYVYISGGFNGGGGQTKNSINGGAVLTSTAPVHSSPWDEASDLSGNYLLYSGLTASSFFVTQHDTSGQSGMQGVQIVNTGGVIPEPSTLVLAALGLMGLMGIGLGRRRKRVRG